VLPKLVAARSSDDWRHANFVQLACHDIRQLQTIGVLTIDNHLNVCRRNATGVRMKPQGSAHKDILSGGCLLSHAGSFERGYKGVQVKLKTK
jgi:hypothetical protein